MKYTIEQLKSAARVLKENCKEHDSDCWRCPLRTVNDLEDDWEDYTCILDDGWPEDWKVGEIKEKSDE